MENEPGQGVNFFIPWSLVEYAISAMAAVVSAGALWIWRLAWRIGKLEEDMLNVTNEVREIVEANRQQISELREQLKVMNNDLPSRNFIEGQIGRLEMRMDRVADWMKRQG